MNRLMLTLLGLVLTLPAEAQEALPFKCPAPGATMTTTANNTLTFTRQEGMICHFKRANNTEGAWMAGVVSPTSNLGTRYKDDIEKFWPARVGAKSEFIQIEAWGYQLIVRERKMLTVPAGTFDVLVIDVTTEGIRANNHKSYGRFYYALDFGYPVKYEPVLERGNWSTPPVAYEAVAITKP